MRISRNARPLSTAEQNIAKSVFHTSLPSYSKIVITDGLGIGDRPYTLNTGFFYELNLGPDVYPNAVDKTKKWDKETYDVLFIHEMTHVWQYYHGYNVILSSMWANSLGDGYDCKAGKAWDSYNVEQQATLVEKWYENGMKGADPSYVYVTKIIRPGITGSNIIHRVIITMPYDELKKLDL